MIDRKEFMKSCGAAICAAGLSCAAKADQSRSQSQAECQLEEDRLHDIEGKLDRGQTRFAGFIESLETRFDEQERKQLFNGFGRHCAQTYRASLLDHYKGDIRGFLDEGLRGWMAEASYDEAAGTIRIVDKSPTCTCPLVKMGTTPPSFCDCTLGWQQEAYSTILGRPVRAELEESLLRGGKRCVFRITVV